MIKFLKPPTQTLRHLLIAASALTLVACATATPYQPASETGGFDGFSQQLIENDRARVSFGGNSLTNRDTVENYLLYRSAELAVERGYETFTLQERDLDKDTKFRVTDSGFGRYDPFFGYSFFGGGRWSGTHRFSQFGGFGSRRGFGHSGFGRSGFGFNRFGGGGFGRGGFYNDIDVREITKYRASAEVKFGRNTFSEDPQTFNAKEVLENLGPVISFPEEKTETG